MTEEDTFNALKRVSYETAYHAFMGITTATTSDQDDAMLAGLGWTFRELSEEHDRRRDLALREYHIG